MKKKTVALYNILIFINVLSCIGIPCLEHYFSNIKIIYFIINILTFIMISFYKPKLKIGGFMKYIIVFYAILMLSTIINNGDILQLIYEFSTFFTTLLLINSATKAESKKIINTIYTCLEILIYLNLFIILAFPQGLYHISSSRSFYLFNHVNEAIRFLLPGVCFCIINSYNKNNKLTIRSYLLFGVVALTLLLTWPATGIVGFAIFALTWVLFYKKEKLTKIINPFVSHLFSLGVSYLLIFKNIKDLAIASLFTFLKRDITLTGRTQLWNNALFHIRGKFLLGYGRQDTIFRKQYIGAISSHNNYLDILFEGGIVLLAWLFVTIFAIAKKLKQCANKNIVLALSVTILSYSIMWITLPFSYSGTSLMFMIWLIAYNSSNIFDKMEVKK